MACLLSQPCTSIKVSLASKPQPARAYHPECQRREARATSRMPTANTVFTPPKFKSKININRAKYRIRASTRKERSHKDKICKPPKTVSIQRPHKSRGKLHRIMGPSSNLETRGSRRPRTLTRSFRSSRRRSKRSNRKTSSSTKRTS